MNNVLERVFELIRKEELILFCGAGTSMYAGYPSGKQLADTIYSKMTKDEIDQISTNLPLPDLTEEFINMRMGSRNALITILKDVFEKPPSTFHLHQILSCIPQIKTIITTNYDKLFELAYNNECSIIRNSIDLTYRNTVITEILKIHGDLSNPNSILISKSDYTKFFDTQKEELLWNAVKERIATNSVLFIGYNLDDINMESIFRKMREHLGNNHKEVFLLSPQLNPSKIQSLNRSNIRYIDSTAEDFINQLYDNIKHNIYEDLKNQFIGADTFSKFLNKVKLEPTLKSEKSGFKVTNIRGSDSNIDGNLCFEVDVQNEELIRKIQSVSNNHELGEIVLNNETVNNLNLYLNGIRIPNDTDEKVVLKSAPVHSFVCDITFNNGVEYDKLNIDVYRTISQISFILTLPTVVLTLETSFEKLRNLNFKVNLKRTKSYYVFINDEMLSYSFVQNLGSEGKINIFIPNSDPLTFQLPSRQELYKEGEKHTYYFNQLKKIEKHFHFRFGELKNITQSSYNMLSLIIAHIENIPFIGVFTEAITFKGTIPEKVILFINELNEQGSININGDIKESFNLHDKNILLGYRKTKVLEPYIENLEEIYNNPLQEMIIKSKSESVEITFSDFI